MAASLGVLSKMRFWQRFLILGSSCFLLGTLYHHTLLASGPDPALRAHRRSLSLPLGQSSFHQLVQQFSQEPLDPAVCAMDPWKLRAPGSHRVPHPHPYANLSTLDVFNEADFNVLADGMYELPSPPPGYPSEGGVGESLAPLTVVLMPHSHVDPGWQRTMNEYYTVQTKHILTNMVDKLTQHPDLTFVWAETVYFAMWWNEQEDATKLHVRRLIRRGQLEVVLGGWVMPDEASTHYVSVVHQLMEGHQWLWENLRVAPTNSWSIDPFGYSGSMPYLWKLAGMDNMVIQRVHQAVKASLMTRRSLEFHWRQFWDAEGATDILCHVMPYMLYSIKFSCGPNQFVCLQYDFRSVPGEMSESRAEAVTDHNVAELSRQLYRQFRQKSYFYKHNTILVPIGDDFRYEQEAEWEQQYNNYSRLMTYMNGRHDWKVKVRFGTLKDFFRLARKEQAAQGSSGQGSPGQRWEWPRLSGDFFPYSDRNDDYWTGYFSTRPFDKIFQREVQSLIQAADTAVTLTYALLKGWGLGVEERFFQLASLMQSAHRLQAQFLHHDAITGTSRQVVVDDLERQLLEAYRSAQTVLNEALQALLSRGKETATPIVLHAVDDRPSAQDSPRLHLLKVPEDGLRVVVFNPLPQYRQAVVTLKVNRHDVKVADNSGRVLPCQVNPVWEDESPTTVSPDAFHLLFLAELPPLGLISFTVLPSPDPSPLTHPARLAVYNSDTLAVPPSTPFSHARPVATATQPVEIANDNFVLRVDPQSGRVMEMVDRASGEATTLNLTLGAYRSDGSGAYILKTRGEAEPLPGGAPVVRVTQGPLATEVTLLWPPYASLTLALHPSPSLLAAAVAITTTVNPQTLPDREIILRLASDLRPPTAEFFTDQNGMQHVRRGETPPGMKVKAGVGGRYFPVTTGAWLEDRGGGRRLSLLVGQPHGAASLTPGWLELMLHRHLLHDDGRGLEEGVTHTRPATARMLLLLETRPQGGRGGGEGESPHHAHPSLLSLALQDRLQQPAVVRYSHVDSDALFAALTPLPHPLPCPLGLLSLRSLATANLNYNGTSLLLHHRPYDCSLPTPQSIPLPCAARGAALTFGQLLGRVGRGVVSVRETSLTHLHHRRSLSPGDEIDVRPAEIKAFHVTF